MKKLCKFELLAMARILVPIWGGTLVLSLLVTGFEFLSSWFPVLEDSLLYFSVNCLVLLLFAFAILASIGATVVMGILRFYKLLGDSGYLQFSLPVPAWQHIAARLFCACLTTTLSIVVITICGMLISMGSMQTGTFVVAPDFQFFSFGGIQQLLRSAYALLIWFLLLATCYLFLYLCMAIGAQWPQHRLGASVITYFVLTFILQILLVVVVAAVALGAYSATQSGSVVILNEPLSTAESLAASGAAYGFLALFALLFVAVDAILWAATQYLITKKLNLA